MEPIAFMVMPFGKKGTGAARKGVPRQVDFDNLWNRVYRPLLLELEYQPVRADQDVGALIVNEMLQRLALADVVVADVTLPNANVYYEVGVRHAAKRAGCVLVAADWATSVFDLQQIRQFRFPLSDGHVGEAAATIALEHLRAQTADLVGGTSPVFDAVPGFPDRIDPARLSAFRDFVAELSAFDADVRAARLAPSAKQREMALDLLEKYGHTKVVREAVAVELLEVLRDLVGMQSMLDYIEELPPHVARYPLIEEQRCLALGKTGKAEAAAASLEQLIRDEGPTPERLGLLGGRYKELYRSVAPSPDSRRYLDLAIDSYHRGMLLDLNAYYCASNLPRLYRLRGGQDDARLAAEAERAAAAACRRGIELGTADEWTSSTLLGLAFDAGDVPEARRRAGEAARDPMFAWQRESTLKDLRETIGQHGDEAVRTQLEEILSELTRASAAPSGAPG